MSYCVYIYIYLLFTQHLLLWLRKKLNFFFCICILETDAKFQLNDLGQNILLFGIPTTKYTCLVVIDIDIENINLKT